MQCLEQYLEELCAQKILLKEEICPFLRALSYKLYYLLCKLIFAFIYNTVRYFVSKAMSYLQHFEIYRLNLYLVFLTFINFNSILFSFSYFSRLISFLPSNDHHLLTYFSSID